MNEPWRSGECGASILASLVVVTILGTAALAADFSFSSRRSYAAAQLADSDTSKCESITYCTEQVGAAAKGAVYAGACERGINYSIARYRGKDGKPYVVVRQNPLSPCGGSNLDMARSSQYDASAILAVRSLAEGDPPPNGEEGKGKESFACKGYVKQQVRLDQPGKVKFCESADVSGKESPLTGCKEYTCKDSDRFEKIFPSLQKDAIRDLFNSEAAQSLTSEQYQELAKELNSQGVESDILNSAFDEKMESIGQKINSNKDLIAEINKQLASCVQSSPCDKDLIKNKDVLQEQNAKLQQQLDNLEKGKKTLADEAAKGPPKGPDRPPPGPPGPSPGPYNGPPGPSQSSTFPSQGMGQPPPGNQTPRAPGTCYGGQAICQGNTLYSRNNQCVDTPVQYCQYGCDQAQSSGGFSSFFSGGSQSGRCAPPPRQGQNCPPPPVQPPSGCQNGSWRPTYTGACVSGWQCVPSGSGDTPLTAQLSCQPQIADVGMTITITYSCSSGTSSGSGFQTGGAHTGSTTVTVTNPPAEANTATYGLTCTDQGITASKQCNVQVGKPAIVFVANPKTVPSGATSAIGWVTSGMQSCVISSPELSSFTEQHQYATNVNGAVVTPPLSSGATFVLTCTTVGGNTRQATTTVTVQ